MANLVVQPGLNPTRKLSAAVIAMAIVATLRVIFDAIWPGVFDADFWLNISPVVVGAAGWFTHDEAIPVNASTIEYENPAT